MELPLDNVVKQYRRDFWGLSGLSLALYTGVLGLLGPNGAGKSNMGSVSLARKLGFQNQRSYKLLAWFKPKDQLSPIRIP